MTSYLFRFQIGPVQSFIAQARRTKDLYVGSRMLNTLAVAAVEAATATTKFKSIFPFVENKEVYQSVSSHVFSFIADDAPETVADIVQRALVECWEEKFAKPVFKRLKKALDGTGTTWETTFQRQVKPFSPNGHGWMDFYWVAVKYEGKSHKVAYNEAQQALAQRKTFRHFPQVEEPGEKCSLTGSQSALLFSNNQLQKIRAEIGDPNKIILRDNERLGTLALIKRLWPEVNRDERANRFPSTRAIAADDLNKDEHRPNGFLEEKSAQNSREVEGYFAILHMDGDNMGTTLATFESLEHHQNFSKALSEFASSVKDLVEEKSTDMETEREIPLGGITGRLVYSGGDDVLALIPLKYVLGCATALRRKFSEVIEAKTGLKMTASAGIAITPEKLPLDQGLEMARKAEHVAKELHGRDAIAVAEAHGTSGLRETGAKWDDLQHVLTLQTAFEKSDSGVRTLSGKFPYDLAEINNQMTGGDVTAPMRESIMRRALRRRLEVEPKELEAKEEEISKAVLGLAESGGPKWDDATNWAILARFLASGGKRKGEV